MKESPIGQPEASTTNFQEAPRRQTPTMDELRDHRARVNETRGKLFGAQRAYEEAAVPNKENVRADAAYSEYLQEVVPVTNISGASRASRRNIIDGRATYETDLNKQVADAEAASAAAEQEEEPFTLLGIGEKKHRAWQAKKTEARNTLDAAREAKATFEKLKADMAAAAEGLYFKTRAGRMAESKRLEKHFEQELEGHEKALRDLGKG